MLHVFLVDIFLLETSSSKQSAQLQKTELLGEIPVHISPHRSMNFTKGVIKTSDLKDMSQQEIIANMHSQDVIDCKRISFVCDSKTIDTNTYILTFNRLQLPSTVYLEYLRVRVEQYILCPLRSGDHPSSSKQCPKYQQEQEIIKLTYTLNIPFPEAHKRILSIPPLSYASLATVKTSTIGTQTESLSTEFTFQAKPPTLSVNSLPIASLYEYSNSIFS